MAKSKNKRPTRTFIEVTIVKVSETGECIAQVDEIEV